MKRKVDPPLTTEEAREAIDFYGTGRELWDRFWLRIAKGSDSGMSWKQTEQDYNTLEAEWLKALEEIKRNGKTN